MTILYELANRVPEEDVDYLLSKGWFRFADFYVQGRFICLEERISTMVNLRYPLNKYNYKKSHRRVINRVEKNFITQITDVHIDASLENLYTKFRKYFYGFELKSLEMLINGTDRDFQFNTKQLVVYDNDKPIAASFFDIGAKSIEGIICIYDDNYKKYGLGNYTIIKEILYGMENGFQYYYPGYVTNNISLMDYKLKVATSEFMMGNSQWESFHGQELIDELLVDLEVKTDTIIAALDKLSINYIKFLNPFYSYGYMNDLPDEFIKGVMPVIIFTRDRSKAYALEYIPEEKMFYFSLIVEAEGYEELMNIQDFSYYDDDLSEEKKGGYYLTKLYCYYNKYDASENLEELIERHIKDNFL